MARPKRHLGVLIKDDQLSTGTAGSKPVRRDLRVWRDEIGNWWWVSPWHQVAAQMALWVGWTHAETMRTPLGVLGRVYAAHRRSED